MWPIIPDPYGHFEACAADYATRFPNDTVGWHYGANQLAQNTAQCRVVYIPRGDVDLSAHDLFKGRFDSQGGSDDCPDSMSNDGVGISVHCFGTRRQLFTYRDDSSGEVVWGLRDRVATVLRNSQVGPKNLDFESPQFPQTDFSNLPTCMWEWVFSIRLWIPLYDL